MEAKPLASDLTAAQVRRMLTAAKIDATVSGKGREWEIETKDENGANRVRRIMRIGGYRCGWGGWILQPGYTVSKYAGTGHADPMHY